MGWYHLGGLAPTQDWEMAILALGDSCSSSSLGFVYGYTDRGRRKDYFLFCFHFDSIVLGSDALQTLPLCEQALELSMFVWSLIQ